MPKVKGYEVIDIHAPVAKLDTWPDVIPKLTEPEAARAVRRLFRYACGMTLSGKVHFSTGNRRPVRFAWEGNNRSAWVNVSCGWRELVHDLSHWVDHIMNGSSGHNKHHARLEAKLIREVVRRGYLEGKLLDAEKPPATLTPVYDIRVEKLRRIEARIVAWERKQKRAANALKKLAKSQRYYAKALAA